LTGKRSLSMAQPYIKFLLFENCSVLKKMACINFTHKLWQYLSNRYNKIPWSVKR
jgi:hypothetical protein